MSGLFSYDDEPPVAGCACSNASFMFVGAPNSGTRFLAQCWYSLLRLHFNATDALPELLERAAGNEHAWPACTQSKATSLRPGNVPVWTRPRYTCKSALTAEALHVSSAAPSFEHLCQLEQEPKRWKPGACGSFVNRVFSCSESRVGGCPRRTVALIRDPREVLRAESVWATPACEGRCQGVHGSNGTSRQLAFSEKHLLLVVEYYNALAQLAGPRLLMVSYEALRDRTSNTLAEISAFVGLRASSSACYLGSRLCARSTMHSLGSRAAGVPAARHSTAYEVYAAADMQTANAIVRSYARQNLLQFWNRTGVDFSSRNTMVDAQSSVVHDYTHKPQHKSQ